MNNPPGFPPTVLGKPYPGTGVVTIINQKEGWVEIEHEEIKDLMPAMQMEFWIRNPSLLRGIRVGDKVDFVVVEDRVGQYLTELKRVAPGS
jgi:Cu(I)/Ag(I) efflux system protein CusF